MAIWDRNKVAPASLNSGNEYAVGDQPTQATFNDANNNGFYAVDYAEALADAPDNTDAGTVGTPAVTLIDNVKVIDGVSKTFKKFKFSNLKGQKGDAGINDAIVVQIEGTSVENVISQKGVTDKLVYMRSFPTAGGTATAITVTTGHFQLVAGRSFTFVASANNSGSATTLNADGTGAKNVYRPNTTSAPVFIAGKAYTLWYDGTSFFVKASAEGDAVAGDVVKNKIFSNDIDTYITGTLELTGNAAVGDVLATKTFYNTNPQSQATGTMTNNGTVSTDISAKATEVTIAQGYHSGSGKVKIATAEQNKIITGNIKAGVTILGVAGKTEVVDTSDGDAISSDMLNGKKAYVNGTLVTGNIASKVAATYTPGTSNQTISAGQYLSGAQTIAGDADLTAANIKSGVNIFGVVGTWGIQAGTTLALEKADIACSYIYGTSWLKLLEYTVAQGGTYRIRYSVANNSSGGTEPYTVYAQIYRDGAIAGSLNSSNSWTQVYLEQDLYFAAGSSLQFYGKGAVVEGTDIYCYVRNITISYLAPTFTLTYERSTP